MRKYQRIWEQLKVYGTVSLHAEVDKHRRIVLSTRKEKNRDEAFKVLMLDKGRKYILHDSAEGEVLTLKLTLKIVPAALRVDAL